jgi:hypothetical protein
MLQKLIFPKNQQHSNPGMRALLLVQPSLHLAQEVEAKLFSQSLRVPRAHVAAPRAGDNFWTWKILHAISWYISFVKVVRRANSGFIIGEFNCFQGDLIRFMADFHVKFVSKFVTLDVNNHTFCFYNNNHTSLNLKMKNYIQLKVGILILLVCLLAIF